MASSLDTIATGILTRLGTTDGGRWTSEQAKSAANSAMRAILLTPLLPNMFFFGMTKVDERVRGVIGSDGSFSVPSDMLRFVMLEAGIVQVIETQKIEGDADNWSAMMASTIANPRVVFYSGSARVLPAKSLAGMSCVVYYIPDEFSVESIPGALIEPITYLAASILAESSREFATAKFMSDKSKELLEAVAKSL